MSARIDRADQTVAVGGRTIGYAEYGVDDGPVVMALHGTPAKAAAQLAKELCPNDRIVAAGGPPEELEMRFFTDALLNGPAGAIRPHAGEALAVALGRP